MGKNIKFNLKDRLLLGIAKILNHLHYKRIPDVTIPDTLILHLKPLVTFLNSKQALTAKYAIHHIKDITKPTVDEIESFRSVIKAFQKSPLETLQYVLAKNNAPGQATAVVDNGRVSPRLFPQANYINTMSINELFHMCLLYYHRPEIKSFVGFMSVIVNNHEDIDINIPDIDRLVHDVISDTKFNHRYTNATIIRYFKELLTSDGEYINEMYCMFPLLLFTYTCKIEDYLLEKGLDDAVTNLEHFGVKYGYIVNHTKIILRHVTDKQAFRDLGDNYINGILTTICTVIFMNTVKLRCPTDTITLLAESKIKLTPMSGVSLKSVFRLMRKYVEDAHEYIRKNKVQELC